MRGRSESAVWALAFEFAPAAIFGGAVAFASATALAIPRIQLAPVAAGAAAFAIASLALSSIGRGRRHFRLPQFERVELDETFDLFGEQEPLELDTVFEPPAPDEPEELLLENMFPAIDPDSRVVRLFDRGPAPTAGELRARIEEHLSSAPRPEMPDATQELHQALAALRQSLR